MRWLLALALLLSCGCFRDLHIHVHEDVEQHSQEVDE